MPVYLSPTTTLDNIRNAHSEWYNNSNWCGIADFSAIGIGYGGSTTSVASLSSDGLSVMDFGSVASLGFSGCSSANVIACAWFWTSPATQIVEADARFDLDGGPIWTNGSAVGYYDVWHVAAHEIGHQIGLQHTDQDPTEVMYPTAYWADTSNRLLGKGDANGNNNKY